VKSSKVKTILTFTHRNGNNKQNARKTSFNHTTHISKGRKKQQHLQDEQTATTTNLSNYLLMPN